MFRNVLSRTSALARLSAVPMAVLGIALTLGAPTRTVLAEDLKPDLDGARILYHSTGGLASIDQTLRVFDDGTVKFDWQRPPDGGSYSLFRKLPAAEFAMLKRLFRIADFESMPTRFVPESPVIDGVHILVKVGLADTKEKSVQSETLAVEDEGFTAIRKTLEGIVADLKGSELLRVRSYAEPFDGRERIFTLLSDGRFRIEIRLDDLPIEWMDGFLSPADRDAFATLAGSFPFESTRLCGGEHVDGVQHDVFRAGETGMFAVHYSEGDPDPRFKSLMLIAERIDAIVKAERDGH